MNILKLSTLTISILGLTACLEGSDGDMGANGADGVNSLIMQTSLLAGNLNCPNGGVQFDSGLDTDRDSALSASEITSTEYSCTAGIKSLSNSDLLTSLNNDWYIQSAVKVDDTEQYVNNISSAAGSAKNIILFVGDGMGISTVTASRILEGQQQGMQGEENSLSFGLFPFTGLAKTYNVDSQTPDSAGTMTAMMSGVKTDVGVIGVDEDIVRGDCSTMAENQLVTALELAEISGMSTGVVSTARITHATPAATYAKSAERNWEDISDMPETAVNGGCEDIASQLVNFEENLEALYSGLNVDGIDVVMGGGRRHFLPKDADANSPDAVSAIEGDRTDGRNLVDEWKAKYPSGVYVFDQTGFNGIATESTQKIFGLFNESHMQYEADRGNDISGEPPLTEMTSTAIKVLDNNSKGFFLVVESGRIDHAHHAGNAFNALEDTIEFANAVQAAVDLTNSDDTLIIVTADHGHVFTIAGYPKRGNPILGKVVSVGSTDAATASDGQHYTTLGYTNGLGYRDLGGETDADETYGFAAETGRKDLSSVNTSAPGFHQEALVPLGSETHSGEDVGIYARGPGSHLVTGTNEQNILFHVMNYAGNLEKKANAAL